MELPAEYKEAFLGLSKVQRKKKLEEFFDSQKKWNNYSKKRIVTAFILDILSFGFLKRDNLKTSLYLNEVKAQRNEWVSRHL